MDHTLSSEKKRWLVYTAFFFGIMAVYLLRATASGLWFDESIEYYFSSTLRGHVPGARLGNSMYKRILATYQPPLYNWLMYVWLQLGNSEFWFRLAGILVTFIGGAGLYLGLKEIMDQDWAAGGTAVYLLAGGVSEYALEAGEYNLALCMICWALCFYLRALKREKAGPLLGFTVFCCLAAYSQYGVVFVIVPLYISLLWHFVKRKKMIGKLAFFSLLAVAAAVPLVVYFLLPQMHNQRSDSVSHVPVFAYGAADVFVGLAKTVAFTFRGGKWIQPAVVLPAGALLLFALTQRDKTLLRLLILFFSGWIAYYLLTACSVYGYNGRWNPNSLGTKNIGGRYSLMFAPLLAVVTVYGVYCACTRKPEKEGRFNGKKLTAAALCLFIAYSAVGVGSILATQKKDDVREATQVWYAQEAYNSRTLVNLWDDALFQFYLTHSPDYAEEYQQSIHRASWWGKGKPEQIEKMLSDLGLLDADDFYYISKVSDDYENHYHTFIETVTGLGFAVEEPYHGASALIHAVKK